MQSSVLFDKHVKAYCVLLALIICGLAVSTITASKVIHLGINFPFSNVVFSVFTYPLVDCICELWGKKAARQAVLIALACQIIIMLLLQASIAMPHADFWQQQQAYQQILAHSGSVAIASLIAFLASQVLDIALYQKIKQLCRGKYLWLRTNFSTISGQLVDSSIFIMLVFSASNHKFELITNSMMVKIVISAIMTPVVYYIIILINKYLTGETLAFKNHSENPI